MKISSAALIYFSPTGTTKKIMDSIVKGMQIDNIKRIDLTPKKTCDRAVPKIV